MSALLDRCLKASGRTYPDGYGFALTYLDDRLNPAWLRDGANRIVANVFANGREFAISRKDSDLVDYVNAQAEAESAEGFLIEAAQLILAEAYGRRPRGRPRHEALRTSRLLTRGEAKRLPSFFPGTI
jgi:hypothetical protein